MTKYVWSVGENCSIGIVNDKIEIFYDFYMNEILEWW